MEMRRKTVLVVEDHSDLRDLFSVVLESEGFAVQQAEDGMAALRFLDSAPPDIIVLDLGLPHVSGHDVLFELRQHPHTRRIPVIVVTANPEALEGVEARCVLRKPVNNADLVRAVRDCVPT